MVRAPAAKEGILQPVVMNGDINNNKLATIGADDYVA